MESNIDKKMSKIVFLCCLFWFIAARAARLQLLHNCKQRDGEIRPGPGTGSSPAQSGCQRGSWLVLVLVLVLVLGLVLCWPGYRGQDD